MNRMDEYMLSTSPILARGILDLAPQTVIQVAAKPNRPVDVDRWELFKLLLKLS
jgi:hypothetical protein